MNRCPECDAPLPADAPLGICPRCLMRQGERQDVEGETAQETGEGEARPWLVAVAEGSGSIIGRYKLLQRLGEGGFGVVYMAEQREPMLRRVALKIIKEGMDTKQVIARFEAERQALAMMDHPNIARVLDAGATDRGRPYFVMELVRGVPITRFCDEQKYDTRQRLAVFGDVCSAVQHAHQKGIIHRDLKPSNILVGLDGDKAIAKVIDFGIAKAIRQPLTDKTLFTRFEQFVGTPLYISPEQAQLSPVDVDTRSDIYSLGVILYELLTGKPPLDADRLLAAGLDEMRRMIRETEAPRPSTRVASIEGEELLAIAAMRKMEARKLGVFLRGDLDWIILKAIEKERARRYDTVESLRLDIDRFLQDEPVDATPPSAAYRLHKFVRRHRVGVTIAAAVAVMMVAAAAVSTLFAIKASDAEGAAQQRAVEADEARLRAEESEEIAQRAARRAERVVDQVRAMFHPPERFEAAVERTPLEGRSLRGDADYTLREWVADAEDSDYWEPLREEPEVRASIQLIMALANTNFGNSREATKLAREALDTLLRHRDTDDEEVLSARGHLAYCLENSPDYGGPQQDEAGQLRAVVLSSLRSRTGPGSEEVQQALWQFVSHHVLRKQDPLAVPPLKGLTLDEVLSDGDEAYDAAAAQGLRAALMRRIYGLYQLAFFYQEQERREESLAVYTKIVESLERLPDKALAALVDYPRATSDVFAILRVVAGAHLRQGEAERGLELYRLLLERGRATPGFDQGRILHTLQALVKAHQERADHAAAAKVIVEVLGYARSGGQLDEHKHHAIHSFAVLTAIRSAREGSCQSGGVILRELAKLRPHETVQDELGGTWFLGCLHVAGAFLEASIPEEAKWHAAEGLKLGQAKFPQAWEIGMLESLLGRAHVALEEHADAQRHLLAGYEILRCARDSPPGDDPERTLEAVRPRLEETIRSLVEHCVARGDEDGAASWQAELDALGAEHEPPRPEE